MNQTSAPTDSIAPIIISFIVAFVLSAIPLPEWAAGFRPAWVTLVVIYWVMALPHRVGVLTAWFIGILLDGLMGAALGQNALALSIVAYIVYILHMRIRVFPLWQQCLTMLVLVGIYQLVNILIIRAVYITPWTMWYWVSAVVSAIVWPWVSLCTDWLSRRQRGA